MFLLFACADYYPKGGAHDLVGCYGSEDEARAHLNDVREEDLGNSPSIWAHVCNVAEHQIVAEWDGEVTYDPFRVQWVELLDLPESAQ